MDRRQQLEDHRSNRDRAESAHYRRPELPRHGSGSDTITITNTSPVDLANASNTRITELHYHPLGPDAAEVAAGFTNQEAFEFVEVTNTGVSNIDLTGVRFTDGVLFNFPTTTVLGPGARIIVVSNQAAFESRYGVGSATLAGKFTGNFRNSGEHVRLEGGQTPLPSQTSPMAIPSPGPMAQMEPATASSWQVEIPQPPFTGG